LEKLSLPKSLGGCGLKNIHLFTKSLATKNGWNLIENNGLWIKIFKAKYFTNDFLMTYIRRPKKSLAIVHFFSIIKNIGSYGNWVVKKKL